MKASLENDVAHHESGLVWRRLKRLLTYNSSSPSEASCCGALANLVCTYKRPIGRPWIPAFQADWKRQSFTRSQLTGLTDLEAHGSRLG